MPRYGRSRPSRPIPAGTRGRDGPSPSGTATGPLLPVWEGEIARAAEGNTHEESSPDTHGKAFLWFEAPWPGGPAACAVLGTGGGGDAAMAALPLLAGGSSPPGLISAFITVTSEKPARAEPYAAEKA